MTRIAIELDGIFVPLDQCAWIMRESCGCIASAVVAQVDGDEGWILVTDDQAHRHFEPSEYRRQRDGERGVSIELVRANGVGLWPCREHRPDLWLPREGGRS